MLVPLELVAWWVKHYSLRLHVLFNRKNNNNSFAVVAVARCIYSARAAPVYLYITAMLCDVTVFIVFITLSNITFSREDLDIIYLVINN